MNLSVLNKTMVLYPFLRPIIQLLQDTTNAVERAFMPRMVLGGLIVSGALQDVLRALLGCVFIQGGHKAKPPREVISAGVLSVRKINCLFTEDPAVTYSPAA